MAKEEFDFGALQELKFNEYKKEYCKEAKVKKAKAGLVLTKIDIKAKKKACLFVSFLKEEDAKKAYKTLKDTKDAQLKKAFKLTSLVGVKTGKGADGKAEVTLNIIKGTLTATAIQAAAEELFTKEIKMGLKVTGVPEKEDNTSTGSETSTEEKTGNETSDTSETSTEENTGNETSDTSTSTVDPAKKANRAKKLAEMKAGVEKMDGMKDKLPKDKLEGNIQKYEDALATLIKDAKADGIIDKDEQQEIDLLTNELEKLKKFTAELESGKKLTPERRKKINENMDKINARLEAITKKLGL